MNTKYIFITGGVCSSLGKGLVASAIGLLLERKGLNVALMKIDPHLNLSSSTIDPLLHGEVYITDDGAETDMDIGRYHRFTNSPLGKASAITTGQVFNTVVQKERRGEYLGSTVQIVPHVTHEIKQRFIACSKQKDDTHVVIIELGGTVGDIESKPFLESMRQFILEHPGDCICMHLTYVPFIKAAGEFKTKPTQHSVQDLNSIGIFPTFVLPRCVVPLPQDARHKIAMFCNLTPEAVIEAVDVTHTTYEIPLWLEKQGLAGSLCRHLGLQDTPSDLTDWKELVHKVKNPTKTLKIALVGKYTSRKDTYRSLSKALKHASSLHQASLDLVMLDEEKIYDGTHLLKSAESYDGYVVTGALTDSFNKGSIAVANYCKKEKIPYFGIEQGMQALLGDLDPQPFVRSSNDKKPLRVGSYPCHLKAESLAQQAYGETLVHERHHHSHELAEASWKTFQERGLVLSGRSDAGNFCEILEAQDHPWMLGVIFHPEFKSKVISGHPLFNAFIEASIKHKAP